MTKSRVQKLFEVYYIGLVEFCSRLLRDDDVARDIVQDVFVRLLERKYTLPEDEASLKSYLYRMVNNSAINYIKREKFISAYVNGKDSSIVSEETVVDAIVHAETLLYLHNALERLPSGCRNICTLTYLEENTNVKTAALTNTTINTVKTQKRRAIELLRQKLVPVLGTAKAFLFYFF